MTTTTEKPKNAQKKVAKTKKVKKSKFTLYWENPNIEPLITKINDMRAVLK